MTIMSYQAAQNTSKSSTSPTLTIHHECQESPQSGHHAINTIIVYADKPIYGVDGMQLIARDETEELRALGLQHNEMEEVMSDSIGNYNERGTASDQ